MGTSLLVVSSIPDSVGYISYLMFIEPMITSVSSGFSGYIWLDTKIVLEKNKNIKCADQGVQHKKVESGVLAP